MMMMNVVLCVQKASNVTVATPKGLEPTRSSSRRYQTRTSSQLTTSSCSRFRTS